MSAIRIMIICVLSAVAGIAAGFGIIGVAQRQANAAIEAPGSPVTLAALATPSTSAVGPGGNFVTQVYKAVSPAVVHITNVSEVTRYDFFMRPVVGQSEAVGSGVIVDPSGYILTNSHVVQNPKQLTVVLNDQTSYSAKLVGNDLSTDLALLKIDAPRPLPYAGFGDSSKIEIGEWVVAIGNPRGYDWTVTAGVVSAKNRAQPAWVIMGRDGQPVQGPTITGLIQTDAAINPGNSGGPLLNARGEIIGINERIATSGLRGDDGSIGIGLAIPSNTAKDVFAELKQYGRVQRSWLGITVIHEITNESAKHFNFPTPHGVVVEDVLVSGPAERAGIVRGESDRRGYQFDIIASADGKPVRSKQDLIDLVRNRKPGQPVKLHVYKIRNGKSSESTLTVTLSAVPTSGEMSGYI